MKSLEWIHGLMDNGLLCKTYISKVLRACSKKQLYEICSDANGISYLCEMRDKGYALDYKIIKEEYKNYINGAYKPTFGEGEVKYSTAIYCEYNSPKGITIDTTCTCLLGCKTDIYTTNGMCAQLFVDSNCDITIHADYEMLNIVVNVWGDARVSVIGNKDKVSIKYNGKKHGI